MFPDLFQTERLVLRPIIAEDAGPIFEGYAQDPEVTRFLTWRPHRRIGETEAYVARCQSVALGRTYVLTDRARSTVLGAFELRHPAPFRVDCGYVLARSSWGQGLMSEALTHVARWALDQPGLWRIGSVCDVENLGSARVMLKVGLVREGLLRRWIVHPNLSDEPRDCFSFAKVR